MKNFKIISIISATLLFIFTAVNVTYAGALRIHNKTRYTISKVYVNPYGRNYSSRKQNSHAIPSGKVFMLGNIPTSRSSRYWNLKIVLSNGRSYEWKKVDLYSHRRVVIHHNGSRLDASWD